MDEWILAFVLTAGVSLQGKILSMGTAYKNPMLLE